MFIKYCVFSKVFRIFGTLASLCFPLVSVCVYTHQCCNRTGRVQKNHKILRKKPQTTILNEHPVYLGIFLRPLMFLESSILTSNLPKSLKMYLRRWYWRNHLINLKSFFGIFIITIYIFFFYEFLTKCKMRWLLQERKNSCLICFWIINHLRF